MIDTFVTLKNALVSIWALFGVGNWDAYRYLSRTNAIVESKTAKERLRQIADLITEYISDKRIVL